jgi:hypothetical protein
MRQGIFPMFTHKVKIVANILVITLLLVSGIATLAYGQMTTQTCETCGMMVAPDAQMHLKVVDSTGTTHYVDCLRCALKLLKTYDQINITTNCDWNGPTYAVTINLKDYVNSTVVTPSTALFIDGGCTKNRVVYNQAAADALIANNGTSSYLTMMQNVTIPSDAAIMTIDQAAIKYGFVSSPDPTPTPSPTPTASPISSPTYSFTATPTAKPTASPTPIKTPDPTLTPSPTDIVSQTCESCGMEVPPNAQAKYIITDGNGVTHYAECYMCALNLINKYDKLTVNSYCDWYGPNSTVTVESSQFGKTVSVTPTTAMFLNGGSCVINRVAYNQTAADALLANGFSMYTLPMQHYDLPPTTKVTTVENAALTFASTSHPSATQTPLLLIVATVIGVIIVSIAGLAFWKMKH